MKTSLSNIRFNNSIVIHCFDHFQIIVSENKEIDELKKMYMTKKANAIDHNQQKQIDHLRPALNACF